MNGFQRLILAAVLVFPGMVSASVVRPALDIQDMAGDAGAAITGSTFDIDATAFIIVTDSDPIDIADQPFMLTSTGTYDGSIGSFDGTFTVGGGLLTGAFEGLVVGSLGGADLQFLGDVAFTGGSLMAGPVGRIEGITSGSDVVAKLGAVVPVPAAVWLFGSGLLGLVGMARRKKAV